jgi:hypothetical protein
MRRTHLFLALIAAAPLAGAAAWLAAGRAGPARSATAESPRSRLPLSQVVLFNTGVGYFQREGALDGDARIDLVFPLTDVNDLLKSLTVEEGGTLGSVSYDSTEPIEQTLTSFAVDLNGNPTFGQILNQARGEKVEVALEGAGGAAGSTVTGTIVGMEAHFEAPAREVHHLNVHSTEGMRRLPLDRIARVRFLDPGLDEEFRRALGLLSSGHSNRRRSLSLNLKGDGKRDVKVGYVVESPIWKASYRLVLDGKSGKPRLLGWAVVENATDEDWKGVRMVLVSGRPITFAMDLAQPLYVPRPPLEPEVYASLRPPTFPGALATGGLIGGLQGGLQLGGLGALGAGGLQVGGFNFQGNVNLGVGGGAAGFQGRLPGGFRLNPLDDEKADGKAGPPLIGPGGLVNRYQLAFPASGPNYRLSYQELVQRTKQMREQSQQARAQAKQMGSLIAGRDESIEAIAVDADRIGESFRYRLDRKVNLPRKRSALLPVGDSAVAVTRLSIYNRSVHPRFPLLGVRLKNTTGMHLQQGPVAVFEGGCYAGDSRLPDLQPGQERLVSYAMDLGLEVRDTRGDLTLKRQALRVAKGVLTIERVTHVRTTYRLHNRSKADRALLVEHPAAEGWTLVEPAKPSERSRELHRFAWQVPAGKTIEQAVVEEQTGFTSKELLACNDGQLEALAGSAGVSKAVKEALTRVVADRRSIARVTGQLADLQKQRQEAMAEQDRLRLHVEKLPAGSAAQKRALARYDKLDAELDRLPEQIRDRQERAHKQQQQLESYVKGLKVE